MSPIKRASLKVRGRPLNHDVFVQTYQPLLRVTNYAEKASVSPSEGR